MPTNDPTISLGNQAGTIADLEKRLPAMHGIQAAAGCRSLAMLLLSRGEVLGRIADYERALPLAIRATEEAPADKYAWQALGSVHALFHRFAEALVDYDKAQALGATSDELSGPRASVMQALGRLAEAEAIRKKMAVQNPTLSTLGALAAVYADEGRTLEADKNFIEAQHHFRDIAPYPVAWLYLQHATMWQKAGRLARARELLEAAHERLPQYAPATAHLASALAVRGDAAENARAIKLLRELVLQSDDPEFVGQLAALLRSTGERTESEALDLRARKGYEALLAAHPEAFADHAARFFLLPGEDVSQALRWAEFNYKLRQSGDAFQLVVDAALAAGQPARACALVDGGLATQPRTSRVFTLAWNAYNSCGQKERAAQALRTAQELTPHG